MFAFRNTVYSVVALISALSGVAVLFFQLGAAFIGVLQIILYAGAILVLFLFVVMLLNVHKDEMGPAAKSGPRAKAMLAGLLLLLQLLFFVRGLGGASALSPNFGTAAALAEVFFSRHALAFELTSFLLLASMIGAVLLARRSAPGEN